MRFDEPALKVIHDSFIKNGNLEDIVLFQNLLGNTEHLVIKSHGGDPATPVTVVANASRPNERQLASTLASLPADLEAADLDGPAVLLLGLAPRAARAIAFARQEVS